MNKSPTLARKLENGKFKVVLKAKEWSAGVMMLREPPFLFASSLGREMQSTKTNEMGNEDEQNRVKRYSQWKSKGAPDEHILLQELILKKGDFTQAKRCLRETFSFQHEFDEQASLEAVERFLKQKMVETKGFFSGVSSGNAFFPMISHMKVTEKETEANTCIWYENSNAYVYPLQTLYQNNEIVVFHGQPQRDKETQFYLDCASFQSMSSSPKVNATEEALSALEQNIKRNKHLALDIIRLQLLFLSQKLVSLKEDQKAQHKCIQESLGRHFVGIGDLFRCIQNDLFAQQWISLWFSANGFYSIWSDVTDMLVEPLFSLANLAWDEKDAN